MSSSYTPNIGLEKPASGDYNNTWATPVNADWDIVDKVIGGSTTINVVAASGTVALTLAQYQNRIITFSGLLTANVNYQLPSGIGGFWFIYNNTTGSFTLTISSAGGGTTQVIPQSYTQEIICNGTNVGKDTTAPTSAAGSNTQVQFNSSGSFGASSGLTWNGTTLTATALAGPLTGNASSATQVNSAATFNNGGAGDASGTTFNGSAARTISYNTVGAPSTTGTNASGTWAISVSGSAASLSATLAVGSGGTGLANYTIGDLIYASGATTLAKLADVATGNVLLSGGVGVAPSYGKVSLTTAVTGALPVANGGTGSTTAATARTALSAAESGANTDITSLSPTGGLQVGAPTGGAQGTGTVNATGLFINGVAVGTGTGSVTSVNASTGLSGLSFSGGPITTSGTLSLTGTLGLSSGGTGATTASGARTALQLGTIVTQDASNVTITGGTVTGITDIAVADGGTGASTAANARTNLGAAASGANSDITSLTGLSTALALAFGGTAATTAAGAFSNIVASASSLGSSGYMTLVNGWIVQWGTNLSGGNGWSAPINFPTTFPTACFGLVATFTTLNTGATDGNSVAAMAISTSQFELGSDDTARNAFWIALGN